MCCGTVVSLEVLVAPALEWLDIVCFLLATDLFIAPLPKRKMAVVVSKDHDRWRSMLLLPSFASQGKSPRRDLHMKSMKLVIPFHLIS